MQLKEYGEGGGQKIYTSLNCPQPIPSFSVLHDNVETSCMATESPGTRLKYIMSHHYAIIMKQQRQHVNGYNIVRIVSIVQLSWSLVSFLHVGSP